MRTIEEQLMLHEGIRLQPYICPAGYWTIGVGRNLESKGLSDEEQQAILGTSGLNRTEVIERLKEQVLTREQALFLLRNDIQECEDDLRQFTWFERLNKVRKKVVIDMRFNLGPHRFRQFKRMMAALEFEDYRVAASEMEKSLWYEQVGQRGKRLVEMMRTGLDY